MMESHFLWITGGGILLAGIAWGVVALVLCRARRDLMADAEE